MASRRAFTITELLVVIVTGLILVAILLPSLGNSRARAKEIACMSNLRQIATACKNYMIDARGENPWPTSPGLDYFRYLDDLSYLYNYTGQSAKVFKCPSCKSQPMTYERLLAFKQDYMSGAETMDIEQHSPANNGHGNNVYDLDPSNNSQWTQDLVASKAPSEKNAQQHIFYDRNYGWHMNSRSIMVASYDDLHAYKEKTSLLPYWMIDDTGNIVRSSTAWPDLGVWPND
jgi:type II secretory pathway pseudopilin PulG